MLSRAKRNDRISKEEKEKEKKAEQDRVIDELKREVNILRNELDMAYDLQDKADKNATLLEKLFDNNIIDEEGNLKI